MSVGARIGKVLGAFERDGQSIRAIYLSPEGALAWAQEQQVKAPVLGTINGHVVRLGRRSAIYNCSGVARSIRK